MLVAPERRGLQRRQAWTYFLQDGEAERTGSSSGTGTWIRISGTKATFSPRHPAEHCHCHFTPTCCSSSSRWKTPRHQLDLASSRPPNRTAMPREGTRTCRALQLLAPGGPSPSSALPPPAGLRRQDQPPPRAAAGRAGRRPWPSWSDSPWRQGGLVPDRLSSSAVK